MIAETYCQPDDSSSGENWFWHFLCDSNSNCLYFSHCSVLFSPLFSRLPYRTTKTNIPLAVQDSVALSQHVEQLQEYLIQLYVSEALYRYLAVVRETEYGDAAM